MTEGKGPGRVEEAACDHPAPRRSLRPVRQRGGDGGEGHGPRVRRVLIVEDEYFIALAIENAVEDAGLQVVGVAATAEQAIGMAEAGHPDIVLMDIRLAGARDGIDAAVEIRDRFGIPSIFATAQADPATRRRAEQAAHPVGWLLKPFTSSEVVAAIGGAARPRRGGH